LFDTVEDADQLLLAELESETSDRLHRWREFVDPRDARFGNGWGPVMASFCYVRPGRFNSERFGAYYSADSAHTAIAEWSHHAGRTWSAFGYTDEASATLRIYTGRFAEPLVDLKGDAAVHHPDDYRPSQEKALALLKEGAWGILYHSVRRKGGLAAALLRPPATTRVTQGAHYNVRWDGQRFVAFAAIGKYEAI
jgi:hypothetical protein